jgi:hypothetical protein
VATCQIDAIFQAIHDLSPTFDTDVTIPAWDYDEVNANLSADTCPVRVLMVGGVDTAAAEEFIFVALGSTISVRWRLLDRLYLKALPLGRGTEEASPNIIKYAASYVDALRLKRGPTAQSHVLSASFRPSVQDWGSTSFFCIDVDLVIEEYITGT